jgi:hypothetical protein
MKRTQELSASCKDKLVELGLALVDQDAAHLLVPAQRNSTGHWFGGGNMIEGADGVYLVGRYRNFGDSRTGLGMGERGLELAIFRADHFDGKFEKVKSFSKADLSIPGRKVVSIEGAALFQNGGELELYFSAEKDVPYPASLKSFQKSGAGVWEIDMISGRDVASLSAAAIRPVLRSTDHAALHLKDPVVFALPGVGDVMFYGCNPFTWASGNTGMALRKDGNFEVVTHEFLSRGSVWDVAEFRITERMAVPKVGAFKDLPPVSLYFYDGAECVRKLDEHPNAHARPRGYSCEEIAGLAWGFDDQFPKIERLSVDMPLFISPYGTGCCRYISTLTTASAIHAFWQQSQPDLSQPLVGHSLPLETAAKILS